MGAETLGGVTEDRYGGATPAAVNAYFDNVNDYDGFNMAAGAVLDINKNATVSGYSANIAVAPVGLFGIAATDANGAPQVLQITVTVTGPDNVPIKVDGYRTRYAPNSVP
jgi:MSHA pilin protein MshD